MRRVSTFLLLSLLCFSASAQKPLDYFVIVEAVFSNDFSISDFKEKYKDYIIEADESADGKISLRDIELNGYKSTAEINYYSDSEMKFLAIRPEYNSFFKADQYLYAIKCHSYMLDRFGAPDKTEEGSPSNTSIIEETTYTWHRENGLVITGTLSKTKRFNLYRVIAYQLPYNTTTTVQRNFFKTFELGKVVSKEQIALALGANTNNLHITKQSSGISYTCTKPIYFGGIEWTTTEFETVENVLSSIMFTHICPYDNREVFSRISTALTQKYGSPKVYNDEQAWFDGRTFITLLYQYGLSKNGEMKHYVYLIYLDHELHSKASQIIQSEL